jgi:cyclophilin family peptidyl-prolyl cis-trans isomerase
LFFAGCGPTAAPAAPTPTRAPQSTPGSASQLASGLTPIAKSASAAASPAAQGAPVSSAAPKQFSSKPAMEIDKAKKYTATFDTSMGPMTAELFASEVPETVNNFVFLARQGFYDGVTFHRVINNFMIQTGDPTGTGTGGPGYRFNDEPVTRKYERGTLAMANAGPNTNGSQFFIVHKDYALPPNYTIFGKLTSGLETLDKTTTSPTGQGRGGPDTPRTEIKINSIKIDET